MEQQQAQRRPIYLYRIEWADVRPTKSVAKRPIIAGGVHDASEARRLVEHMLGSRPFIRSRGIRGIGVIRRVRRIGLDTPATRDAIALGA